MIYTVGMPNKYFWSLDRESWQKYWKYQEIYGNLFRVNRMGTVGRNHRFAFIQFTPSFFQVEVEELFSKLALTETIQGKLGLNQSILY